MADTIGTERMINPTEPQHPTQTFHPFPHLPYELRIKIWAYAIPESFLETRISYSEGRGCIRLYKSKNGITPRLFQHARTYPALFAVDREARFEASRIDGGEWLPLDLSAPSEGWEGENVYARESVYVNVEKETVVFYDVFGVDEVVRVWGGYCAKPVCNFWGGVGMHCVVRISREDVLMLNE
ncbi:hypothetical protein T440DRAFT_206909 [Plenodomus tracheiphilus IPT5]|uniref:2EXR domain-containing protein n=1 Tax=Plenodomus tracheiphilus IPT5 TaxID=1408161 RepID=A0A6A7BJ35_9PLEO|nr:hypothetical protein T440DRAFT_206909 [Plenodomus tracheiphilus IPT5]